MEGNHPKRRKDKYNPYSIAENCMRRLTDLNWMI